jgi:carboxypeptidase Taq
VSSAQADGKQATVSPAVQRLRARMATIADLDRAAALLGWDQQTKMPPRAAEGRAETLATLEELRHQMFIAAETGHVLDDAASALNGTDPDTDDARLVSVMRRRWEKARRVPSDLAAEMARAASLGQEAWVQARADSDFALFLPYLQHNYELARRYIDCAEGYDCAYDVLLDDYDEGTRTEEVRRLFGALVDELTPLIGRLRGREPDTSILHGSFPIERQRALVEEVIGLMGYEPTGWRLDEAVHPFASSAGSRDIRLTTRWDEGYFPSGLYGGMHECGHGLYEQGVADSLQRTPLEHAASLGLHESQSRLWENMVGRGRPFATMIAPRFERVFGVRLDPDRYFRAVNAVSPSFIRVDADEATYGLHIVLRFELEQQLIEGTLAFADVPEAWNARFAELLGLKVDDDAQGVLQDVHWSAGIIGYFPTYALGNLIAGHLWQQIGRELPERDAAIARGELTGLREWLREKIHHHGAKFDSRELLARVTGETLSVVPFITYLKAKLTDVYGVAL